MPANGFGRSVQHTGSELVRGLIANWRPLLLGTAIGVVLGASATTGYPALDDGIDMLRGAPQLEENDGRDLPAAEDRDGDERDGTAQLDPEYGEHDGAGEPASGADDDVQEAVTADEVHLTQPVAGDMRLVKPFDWFYDEDQDMWLFHPGITLAQAPGSDVLALKDGEVTAVEPAGDGVLVTVAHGGELVSQLRMGQAGVAGGERVERGEPLGHIGADGELYLEIRVAGEALDPWHLLGQNGSTAW